MADAENKGKRRRSDQEVGKKVGVQTRSGAATKRLRQATIKHGTGNVDGKKIRVRMRGGAAAKRSTTIEVRTRSAAATKRQREKMEAIPTATSLRQQLSDQQPSVQPPAEHQQPNVEHPDDQKNINQHQKTHQQQDDEHGAGGIPLQHDNTDDGGCCRVFKNKRLRDLFVEPSGSNFDEAVADDGHKRYHLSKIATMHDAPHDLPDKGLDQWIQLELSEGQLPYSYEGSSSKKSKSRILGSTRSTATSDPFYTAEEVEREVAYALARQEIWHLRFKRAMLPEINLPFSSRPCLMRLVLICLSILESLVKCKIRRGNRAIHIHDIDLQVVL